MRKDGKQSDRQRYRCSDCGYRFQGTPRPARLQQKVWRLYVHKKQTYAEIAHDFGRSIKWVQGIIDEHSPCMTPVSPRRTPLVIDGFYFSRKQGVLVFRSPTLRRNLLWNQIGKETVQDYENGITELIRHGFKITGVTVDGKPGAIQRLEKLGLPVQMCHFHQIAIVTRYTTQSPRLLAARELKALVRMLPETDRASFEYWLNEWHTKWEDFLKEKSFDITKQHWRYTHQRLRRAYRSLVRHMPNLFTYLDHRDMPNTTNSLDGTFAHVRDRLNLHRGLKWHRKMKLLGELLRQKNT